MSAAADRKVAGMYGSLAADERVRLLARLRREGHDAEVGRLLAATPPEHGGVYNHAIDILRRLDLPLGPIIQSALHAAERDVLALQALLIVRSSQRNRRVYASVAWRLVGYPVTESEYRALVEQQRGEPWTLDRIAGYLADFSTEDAGDLHPTVAAWLREAPDDLDDDEALRQLRALLEAAIARGELPRAQRSADGPTLCWGALADWLYAPNPGAYQPPLPVASIPALGVLGGEWADWDVRPDGEAEAVRARREDIIGALAALAHLSEEESRPLDPHPPTSLAARQAAETRLKGLNPWLPLPALRQAAVHIGERHADFRALLRAITAALETVQGEDFGGEDPVLPHAREALEEAWQQERALERSWADVGKDLGAGLLDDHPWPPLPDKPPEREEFYRTRLLEVLREDE
ncbi:MAG: hypothetical protein AVDCRST_MAG77-177 [uncultured Chloroflexi bacterium]|uniref:Uncharacterized protein n=1 Tax=uncultured Chloroflexota bacterium TaxID=166587 RepID=A0A6J4H811_9CHLR|nr:MAG: hypothetical protein AVDCRST_MAG77-177 [uncultured Chloroflexota bacterium]